MSDAGAPPDTLAPAPELNGAAAAAAPPAEPAAPTAPAAPAAPPAPPSSTGSAVVYDTGPRHPNDAAPGRLTKGGSLLTGGYLANKIYVGNLPDSATLADLEDCFGQIGPCACVLKRGFGFVEYVDPAHAAEAVAKYHEGHFLGSQIKVELSLARQPATKEDLTKVQTRNAPGSDRPSDPRKPMWINSSSGPGGPPAGRGGAMPPRGRGGPAGPGDYARDRYGLPAPGYGPVPVPYGAPRYDERPPYDRPPPPGYGPPRDYDRYGPPPGPHMPPPGYGPPVDRPPYDPYYDRAPAYAPYAAAPVPGYPPAAPYDRPPYPAAGPPPLAAAGPRDPYAERYPLPPTGSGRSPLVGSRGSVPPGDPARAPYPPLDPYARPPPDLPPSGAYDPRDERGAGARYQPYPIRDERAYDGRSPTRGAPSLERRRSLSPRRNGRSDPYARDPYGPPPVGSNVYTPYDARGPAPMPPVGYGPPPPGGRSPPRYPPLDEYVPRR